MDCDDINIGELMAVENRGLYAIKAGPLTYGHVVKKDISRTNGMPIYFIMWDNGNSFWYNREEIQKYKSVIDIIRKG